MAEERNQEVDRKGLGEEQLYSGVLRTCADVAKAAGGSSRAAPPSSSPFRSDAEKSKEDDTSAAVVSNDEERTSKNFDTIQRISDYSILR